MGIYGVRSSSTCDLLRCATDPPAVIAARATTTCTEGLSSRLSSAPLFAWSWRRLRRTNDNPNNFRDLLASAPPEHRGRWPATSLNAPPAACRPNSGDQKGKTDRESSAGVLWRPAPPEPSRSGGSTCPRSLGRPAKSAQVPRPRHYNRPSARADLRCYRSRAGPSHSSA
jgi:hypothetical protein